MQFMADLIMSELRTDYDGRRKILWSPNITIFIVVMFRT